MNVTQLSLLILCHPRNTARGHQDGVPVAHFLCLQKYSGTLYGFNVAKFKSNDY